jgi:hypothetical protein
MAGRHLGRQSRRAVARRPEHLAPVRAMDKQRLPVHEDERRVREVATQPVEDREAVGVDVAPGVHSASMQPRGSRRLRAGEDVDLVLSDEDPFDRRRQRREARGVRPDVGPPFAARQAGRRRVEQPGPDLEGLVREAETAGAPRRPARAVVDGLGRQGQAQQLGQHAPMGLPREAAAFRDPDDSRPAGRAVLAGCRPGQESHRARPRSGRTGPRRRVPAGSGAESGAGATIRRSLASHAAGRRDPTGAGPGRAGRPAGSGRRRKVALPSLASGRDRACLTTARSTASPRWSRGGTIAGKEEKGPEVIRALVDGPGSLERSPVSRANARIGKFNLTRLPPELPPVQSPATLTSARAAQYRALKGSRLPADAGWRTLRLRPH